MFCRSVSSKGDPALHWVSALQLFKQLKFCFCISAPNCFSLHGIEQFGTSVLHKSQQNEELNSSWLPHWKAAAFALFCRMWLMGTPPFCPVWNPWSDHGLGCKIPGHTMTQDVKYFPFYKKMLKQTLQKFIVLLSFLCLSGLKNI